VASLPVPPADSLEVGVRHPSSTRRISAREAKVIATLLAADALPERDRIRSSGLSPRTYETARRRIFAAGWVYERFVPDPLAWGWSAMQFTVVQPGAGRESLWSDRLSKPSGVFHMWRGENLVFAARLLTDSHNPRPGGPELALAPGARRWELTVDLRKPTVPIFFDFEGAWSRIAGSAGPRVYPRPLPRWRAGATPEVLAPASALKRDAGELVRRSFSGSAESGLRGHLGSVVGFRAGRRALHTGIVARRSFLDLSRLPGVGDWRLRSVGFVYGTFESNAVPESLYRDLLHDGGVTPFLFATDEKSLLIGALSPAPRPSGPRVRRRTTEIFSERLSNISLVGTPVSSLSAPVDHRYDRALSST
jgi:hypothetical protein